MRLRSVPACLGILASSAIVQAAAQSPPPEPEAPVAIAVPPAGSWRIDEGMQSRPARGAVLRYQARVFPEVTLDLLSLSCGSRNFTRVEIVGLLPAQRFPQPRLVVRIGPSSWTATPNAEYHARSQPYIDQQTRVENDRPLSWPGHPAYASLTFSNRRSQGLLQALETGAPVQIEFERQRRNFPAVPSVLASRF